MSLVLYAHVTRSTKDFAQRKRGVWLGKWQYAKPSPKKRNLDNAIDYRLKNHLIPHEKIVEKFALEMTVSAFRKACSRAKPKESLGPTPAKAPPTSEPTAPTPHKYPRGELHDQIMAEASLQLANNWKKYGQGTRMYGKKSRSMVNPAWEEVKDQPFAQPIIHIDPGRILVADESNLPIGKHKGKGKKVVHC